MRTHFVDIANGATATLCGRDSGRPGLFWSQDIGAASCQLCLKRHRLAEAEAAEAVGPLAEPLPATLGAWQPTPETLRALRNYRDFGRLAEAFTPLEIVATLTNLGWVNGPDLTPAGAAQIHGAAR